MAKKRTQPATKEKAAPVGQIGTIKGKEGTFELKGYSRRRLEKHFELGGKPIPVVIVGQIVQPVEGSYRPSAGTQEFKVRGLEIKARKK